MRWRLVRAGLAGLAGSARLAGLACGCGVTVAAEIALACTCVGVSSPLAELTGADFVFSGTVEAIDAPGPRIDPATGWEVISSGDPVTYLFQVDVVWKGEPTDYATVESARGGSSCGYVFQECHGYLVYATRHEGKLVTHLCTRTRPLERAAVDLMDLPEPIHVRADEGFTRPTIEDLIASLSSVDPQTRLRALNALAELGPRAAAAVPAALALADSARGDLSCALASALGRMAPHDSELSGKIAAAAADTSLDPMLRSGLLGALWRRRTVPGAAVLPATEALHDRAAEVRRAAYAYLLGQDHRHDWSAEEALIRAALGDPSPSVRRSAVDWLQPHAKAGMAFPLLVEAARDSSVGVREAAARLLGEDPAAESALVLSALLRDDAEMVRRVAFLQLERRIERGAASRELLCPARANTSQWFRRRLEGMRWLQRYPCDR